MLLDFVLIHWFNEFRESHLRKIQLLQTKWPFDHIPRTLITMGSCGWHCQNLVNRISQSWQWYIFCIAYIVKMLPPVGIEPGSHGLSDLLCVLTCVGAQLTIGLKAQRENPTGSINFVYYGKASYLYFATKHLCCYQEKGFAFLRFIFIIKKYTAAVRN